MITTLFCPILQKTPTPKPNHHKAFFLGNTSVRFLFSLNSFISLSLLLLLLPGPCFARLHAKVPWGRKEARREWAMRSNTWVWENGDSQPHLITILLFVPSGFTLQRSENPLLFLDKFKNSVLFMKTASPYPEKHQCGPTDLSVSAVSGLPSYCYLSTPWIIDFLLIHTSLQTQICIYTIFVCIIIKRNLALLGAVYSISSYFISNHFRSSLYWHL